MNKTENQLEIALHELEKTNQTNQNAGACLYTPPSGRPSCLQLTPSQCAAIGGMYIGGSCSSATLETNTPLGETNLPDSPFVEHAETSTEDCVCTYGGQIYSKGTTICMGGKQYKCGCSGWVNLGFNC